MDSEEHRIYTLLGQEIITKDYWIEQALNDIRWIIQRVKLSKYIVKLNFGYITIQYD